MPAALVGQLTAHLLVGADVELGDVDVADHLLVERERLIDVLLAGAINIIVPLHADTMDGHTGILHLLHHIIDALALHGVALIIVVVEEQRFWVGSMCILKGLGNELVAAKLVHHRLSARASCHSRQSCC